jgi:CBS domain-containing protein
LRSSKNGNTGIFPLVKNDLLARDAMTVAVVKVREDLPVGELVDLFQQEHVHGAAVVDDGDVLVGFVSQEDVLFGMMGMGSGTEGEPSPPKVADIMTAPAVFATEQTRLADVCRLMWQLRIHHVPIVRQGRVTGIVSTLDVARVVAGESA